MSNFGEFLANCTSLPKASVEIGCEVQKWQKLSDFVLGHVALATLTYIGASFALNSSCLIYCPINVKFVFSERFPCFEIPRSNHLWEGPSSGSGVQAGLSSKVLPALYF